MTSDPCPTPPIPLDPELLAAGMDAASNFSTLDIPAYHERRRLLRLTPDALLVEADAHLQRLTELRLARDKPGAAEAASAASMVLEVLAGVLDDLAETEAPVTDAEPDASTSVADMPEEDTPNEHEQDGVISTFDRFFMSAVAEKGIGVLMMKTGHYGEAAEYLRGASGSLHYLACNLVARPYVPPAPDANGDVPF